MWLEGSNRAVVLMLVATRNPSKKKWDEVEEPELSEEQKIEAESKKDNPEDVLFEQDAIVVKILKSKTDYQLC